MSEFYQLTPEYHEEIRRLQRSDPADAEDTFNPLFQAILENILAVKTGLEDHNQSTNAHADIRQVLGGNMDALLADLAAHTGIAIGNPLISSPDFPLLHTVHEIFIPTRRSID